MSERLKKKTLRVARWILKLRADVLKTPAPMHPEGTALVLWRCAQELVGDELARDILGEIQKDENLRRAEQAAQP